MDIAHAMVKAVVQGLTEFLPVSSTAHLTLADALFAQCGGSNPPLPGENEFYDILLHLGTLSAVLIYFRRDLLDIILMCLGKKTERGAYSQLGVLQEKVLPIQLIVSMFVTVVVILTLLKGSGFLMSALHWNEVPKDNLSEFFFRHPRFVGLHLLITGCLLWGVEMLLKKRQNHSQSSFELKHAAWVGLAQGYAAIFHGISRSGSTMATALVLNIDRLTAARYSFLLSIPTFLMAAAYECLKLHDLRVLPLLNWPLMLSGTVVSAIVGYYCVKQFIQFVASHSLKPFAVYCWGMGIAIMIYFSVFGYVTAG